MSLKRALAIIFMIFLVGSVGAQDEDDLIVRLVAEPVVENNESVALELVVLNDDGTTVGGLTAENVTLSEQTSTLNVEAVERRPLALIVIVNASVGSDVDSIRQTLDAYFANYYQPGDIVEFFILDARADSGNPRESSPDSRAEIDEVIDGISVAPAYRNLGDTFAEALDEAEAIRANSPDTTVQTLYIAPYLNRVAETDTTRVFANADLPFHVIQVHQAREDTIGIMRQLAENGGGLYVNNQADSLVDGVTPLGELRTLYDIIADNRLIYRLTYQPANPSGPDAVNRTLTITTDDGRSGQVEFSYEGLAESPILQLVEPSDLNYAVTVPAGDEPAREIELQFAVSFPDGNPRPIERLEIQIFNANSGSILQYILEDDPLIGTNGTITRTWTLGEFATVGSFTPIDLVATVTDAFGFQAPVQRDGSINLIAATPVPTNTPVPSPTPTIIPTESPSQIAARDMTTASVIVLPLLAAILLLGLLVVSLRVRLWRQRSRLAQMPVITAPVEESDSPPEDAEQSPEDGADEQPGSNVDGERIYGRLYILEGIRAHEIIIDREEFVIGRSIDAGSHYEIPEDFVHPRHCAFIWRGKGFVVRDLGGKNGTFVDERRVPPNGEAPVPFKARVNITRRILVQLREPDDVQDASEQRDFGAMRGADDESEELRFRPFLQVDYPDTDGTQPDDYRPL